VADTLRLHVSDSAGWAGVDSLQALVRRAPKPGCKLLGLIPCPSISAGYSAVASQGRVYTGPGATAGWTIALGKK